MRGLRFHFFSEVGRPGYVRGVGLEVFEVFRTAMRELGLVMQVFCDWQLMEDLAAIFRISGREVVSRGIATRQPGVADVGNGLATSVNSRRDHAGRWTPVRPVLPVDPRRADAALYSARLFGN